MHTSHSQEHYWTGLGIAVGAGLGAALGVLVMAVSESASE